MSSPDDVEQQLGKPKNNNMRPLDLASRYQQDQQLTLKRPPESQHPANRQRPSEPERPDSRLNEARSPSITVYKSAVPAEKPTGPPADSPTLGPTTGLSGMVRQHLRTDSNTSSIYGGVPSAGLVSRFPVDPTEPMPQNDYGTKNNPWETDDWDHGYYGENKFSLDESVNDTTTDEAIPPPLSIRSPNVETAGQVNGKPAWEKDMEVHHTRDGSSETQKEREHFKNELATRRRRVQENLKSFVETESRSGSPMPGGEWSRETNPVLQKTNALGLLKNKTSRGSLAGKPKDAGQSKAMKMLGIGNTTIGSSTSPGKQDFDENAWKQEDEDMLRGVVKGPTIPPQTKAFRQARRDAQRDRERQVAMRHQQRMAAEANGHEWPNNNVENQIRQQPQSYDRVPPNIRTRQRTPSRERHPPPVTHSHRNGSGRESKVSVGTNASGSRPPSRTSRDRSSSDASGRSKSRNGRYRDDLAKAMAEGTASSSQAVYEDLEVPSTRLMQKSPGTPGMAFQQSPIPSPMISSNARARSRSNSKSTPVGYFDPQNLQTLQTGDRMEIGVSPRPSPVTSFSVNSTPSLAQPSPISSAANTPTTTQGFQTQGRIPTNRKRSINKSDISEPRFISSTSRITTVNLPPGASLQNGVDISAPPIPPVNPRRRQTRAMFGALMGRKDDYDEMHSLPAATQSTEEMSTFSADEGEFKPKTREKLRKSSSEGGNLNVRVRQATIATPSPALPGFPHGSGSPPRHVEGAMF